MGKYLRLLKTSSKNSKELIYSILNVNIYIIIYHIVEDSVKDGDTKKTVRYALQQSSYNEESEVVLICGSFFMMAEVREVLGYEVPSDPIASGKTRKTKDKSTKSLHI